VKNCTTSISIGGQPQSQFFTRFLAGDELTRDAFSTSRGISPFAVYTSEKLCRLESSVACMIAE
jgi:hypothetical protein